VLDIRQNGVSVLQIGSNGIQQPQQPNTTSVWKGRRDINLSGARTFLFDDTDPDITVTVSLANCYPLATSAATLGATLFTIVEVEESDTVPGLWKYYCRHETNVYTKGQIHFIRTVPA
jgi:hypothetical protein